VKRAAAALVLAALAAVPSPVRAAETRRPGVVEAIEIPVDTYIFGYPFFTFYMARKQQTNVATPGAEDALKVAAETFGDCARASVAGNPTLASSGRRAIAAMGGCWPLLGSDCSISPDTPEPLLQPAVTAAREPGRA